MINLFGIKFIDADYKEAISLLNKGGLMVVPSGPGLSTIETDFEYTEAVQNADFAITDSGYMILLLRLLKGIKLKKFSGYEFLNNFPEAIGMQKMSLPAVVPWKDEWAETPGISGFVMITTSHISIHTFPEDDYVFIDVFSCRPFDVEKTKNLILEMFEAKTADVNVVKRGLQFRKKQTIMPETN